MKGNQQVERNCSNKEHPYTWIRAIGGDLRDVHSENGADERDGHKTNGKLIYEETRGEERDSTDM